MMEKALIILLIFGPLSGSLGNSDVHCGRLPETISSKCKCEKRSASNEETKLVCRGLGPNSFPDSKGQRRKSNENDLAFGGGDDDTGLWEILREKVFEIEISDSNLGKSLTFDRFTGFRRMKKLSIKRSNIERIGESTSGENLKLESLDLTENLLDQNGLDSSITHTGNIQTVNIVEENFRSFETGTSLSGINSDSLKSLNLSGNAISELPHFIYGLGSLEILDLSNNKLDEDVDPSSFEELKTKLTSLREFALSGNPWRCSPKLSWIYGWYNRIDFQLVDEPRIRCRYDDEISNFDGRLILVMEYYAKYVNPSCPSRDNCTCTLTTVQEKLFNNKHRVYAVEVNCAGQNLAYFPKLPAHTRVFEHNYNEVDNLTLDHNHFTSLPEKLLDMKLSIGFSVADNKLTSISYDLANRLVMNTAVIDLSNNPWTCACRAQIVDMNLLEKLKHKNEMVCGQDSKQSLKGKKIAEVSRDVLCPPESGFDLEEVLLQVLCVILFICIAGLGLRLLYDWYNYRRRGQLPKIAYKIPC